MLYSGREDFSVKNLPGFVLVEEDAHNLGTISRQEVEQLAVKEGFSKVRFIKDGNPCTMDYHTGRLNVVYDNDGKIIRTGRG